MMLSKARFAVLVLGSGLVAIACESAENGTVDAGGGPDASLVDSAVPYDSSTTLDGAAPAADASATSVEGVYEGAQGGAVVEISNAAGCTVIKSAVNGVTCDECIGHYVVGDAAVSSLVVDCKPLDPCSISPAHTNTGTLTRGPGGVLTYFYDYGGGTASLDLAPTTRAPGNVCQVVDAGL